MKLSRLRLLEFFIIGLVLGVVEDLIAIFLATDAEINIKVIIIAGLVALPFAFISEIVVDQKRFPKFLKRILKIEEELVEKIEKVEGQS